MDAPTYLNSTLTCNQGSNYKLTPPGCNHLTKTTVKQTDFLLLIFVNIGAHWCRALTHASTMADRLYFCTSVLGSHLIGTICMQPTACMMQIKSFNSWELACTVPPQHYCSNATSNLQRGCICHSQSHTCTQQPPGCTTCSRHATKLLNVMLLYICNFHSAHHASHTLKHTHSQTPINGESIHACMPPPLHACQQLQSNIPTIKVIIKPGQLDQPGQTWMSKLF